jgi:hypothetical protein
MTETISLLTQDTTNTRGTGMTVSKQTQFVGVSKFVDMDVMETVIRSPRHGHKHGI